MPIRNGCVETCAAELYWAIWDYCPEVARNFHFDIQNGYARVYCGGLKPSAVLGVVSEKFFKSHGINIESWKPVVRFPSDGHQEDWRPYVHDKHWDMSNILFGWQYEKSIFDMSPAVRPLFLGEET